MKRLLITPGEPAGIGPDITLQLAQENFPAIVIAIADSALLQQRASLLGLDIKIRVIDDINKAHAQQAGELQVIPVSLKAPSTPGTMSVENSDYVLDCLRTATRMCLNNQADALVTGPIHKGIINDAGIAFTGHTEFLAELSHGKPVMMLATDVLRVALATTHLPLKDVSQAITYSSLVETMTTLNHFLQQRCNIKQPHILVCGLNPHAGEDGHLGDEEIKTITPAITHCQQQGMNLSGPLPADTAFTTKYLEQADAVLAMYHDQGLPVLKHSGFGRAVNVTLGLPFTRTSVDHGTALDLAGSGQSSHSSLLTALHMANNFN